VSLARQLAAREGVLAGISAGAAVARRAAGRGAPGVREARIAVILPDSGERYVSLPWFGPSGS